MSIKNAVTASLIPQVTFRKYVPFCKLRTIATHLDIPTARSLLLKDTFEQGCPTRSILHQVTNRWSALILAALTDEPHRFAALHTRIEGISQKMLSQNLKALVRAGLVERSVKATVPPQVTYSLTALGTEMTVPLLALMGWIGEHTHELIAAQRDHDAQHTPDETAAHQT